jgi:Protein of unknown function (DUF3565)
VHRAIVGFEVDEVGDWVAVLECTHRQHVRHRPPWQERPWVLTPEGREARLGSPLDCRACDERLDEQFDDEVVEGGDAPCLADRICPDCGAVVDENSHRTGCSAP